MRVYAMKKDEEVRSSFVTPKRNMAVFQQQIPSKSGHELQKKLEVIVAYPIVAPILVLCFVKSMFWKIMSFR